MKTSILLIFTSSIVALTIGVYATFSNTQLNPNNMSSSLKSFDDNYASKNLGDDSSNLTSLKQEMAFLKSELSEIKYNSKKMKDELVSLRGQTGQQENSDGPYNIANNNDFTAIPPNTEEEMNTLAEKQRQNDLNHLEIIKDVFHAETTDQEWSFDTINVINEAIDQIEVKNTSLSSVNCRTSLCVVEVEHDDDDAASAEEFNLKFSMQVGQTLPQSRYFYETHDNGNVTVTMYMSRDGYDLPQVAQE